ncbi:MAG: hypothetical protein FJZ98_07430 [Chloroflexi bacterium]|nr:hypothetical protein [Chloroflexota bacterium]
MSSRYWIKLYHEILDDPKMGRLSDTFFRRVIELFLIAGDVDHEGQLPPIADIAWRLRVDEEALEGQMNELRALGILTLNASGVWIVTHFKQRQSAEPPYKRMRKYREALQKAGNRYDHVTNRNADIDIDRDVEEEQEKEEDAEEENTVSGCSPEDELVETFVKHTRIPLHTGGEDLWARALARLKKAGVEKDDLINALGECAGKGIVIANLGSVVNPAIISMARRKAREEAEGPAKFLRGEYGHVGRHE